MSRTTRQLFTLFLLVKPAQAVLYNVRPQRTGAEEKENEHGTDKKIFKGIGR